MQKITHKNILKEVNKELGDIYGIEVIADVLKTTEKVILRHILNTPELELDLLRIAKVKVYKAEITNPMLLAKGASPITTRVKIIPRRFIKGFIRTRKTYGEEILEDLEDIEYI